jgi:hypothetical protein
MLTSTTSVAQHVGVQDMAMVAAAQAQHAMEEGFGRRGRRDVCQAESAYAPLATLQEESNVISLSPYVILLQKSNVAFLDFSQTHIVINFLNYKKSSTTKFLLKSYVVRVTVGL